MTTKSLPRRTSRANLMVLVPSEEDLKALYGKLNPDRLHAAKCVCQCFCSCPACPCP
jgi:hypothetical protein